MTFFYDLNKRLADLAKKQDAKPITESAEVAESKFSKLAKEIGKNPKVKNPEAVAASIGRKKYGQKAMTAKSVAGRKDESIEEAGYSAKAGRAGKDLGKPGKNFAKIAKSAAERYGSKEAGERVAGAVLNKLRHPKEDIENEGNAFTGALAKTPKGGKFKVGGKEFTDTSSLEEADNPGLEEGYAEMDAWLKSREKEKGTGRFDKRKVSTGTVYTRKPETFDEPQDDEDDTPKKKGRRAVGAGKGKKLGAKVKGTSKLHKLSAIAEDGEYDEEGEMAKGQIHTIVRHAKELESILHDHENLPEWVQEKLGQIKGMMTTVADYMISNREQDIEDHTGREGVTLDVDLDEKAPPGAKAERMVKHIKAGYAKDGKLTPKEKSIAYATAWKAHNKGKVEEESTEQEDQKAEKAGKKVAKDIEHDEGHKAKGDNKAERAGKKVTKDIEYDDKKDRKEKKTESAKPDFLDLDKDGNKTEPMKKAAKEKKVDETTTSGSVATAPAGKSSKGMQFGKGVYESLDTQFKQALTESISIQETVAECGMEGSEPGITIQASGEDAMKLMQLLKLAGLSESHTCPACGHSPCDCEEELDENSPDWPTNTETIDADPNLRTYSSGLNGPKSTGQTTTPVIASQLRRQASVEESVKLEKTLSDLYKNYKG